MNIKNNEMASEPSQELLKSLQEAEDYQKGIINLPSFKSVEELFAYLDNEDSDINRER